MGKPTFWSLAAEILTKLRRSKLYTQKVISFKPQQQQIDCETRTRIFVRPEIIKV